MSCVNSLLCVKQWALGWECVLVGQEHSGENSESLTLWLIYSFLTDILIIIFNIYMKWIVEAEKSDQICWNLVRNIRAGCFLGISVLLSLGYAFLIGFPSRSVVLCNTGSCLISLSLGAQVSSWDPTFQCVVEKLHYIIN